MVVSDLNARRLSGVTVLSELGMVTRNALFLKKFVPAHIST